MLANSFERIHRADLVPMGVVPLRMPEGWRPETLALRPGDVIEVARICTRSRHAPACR